MGVKSGLGWYLQWAQGWAAYANMYAALLVMALMCSGAVTLLFRRARPVARLAEGTGPMVACRRDAPAARRAWSARRQPRLRPERRVPARAEPTSRFTASRASSSPCSVPPAAASPPCCGWWPGWSRRRWAGCWWMAWTITGTGSLAGGHVPGPTLYPGARCGRMLAWAGGTWPCCAAKATASRGAGACRPEPFATPIRTSFRAAWRSACRWPGRW